MDSEIKAKIIEDIINLAETLFKKNAKRATKDAKAFLKTSEEQLTIWFKQLEQGEITQKNFDSLVRGERDLAEMEALKQLGLSKVAIDTFTRGVIDIIINAVKAAI